MPSSRISPRVGESSLVTGRSAIPSGSGLIDSIHTPAGRLPGRLCCPMPLRTLLSYAQREPAVERLAEAAGRDHQRAFASASLRPYLLAGLIDLDPSRPALVVAGDDRAARDLAVDLKAFLAPRPVRFYPSRGVRYESHIAPPPHLVGLRIAALDALVQPADGDAPVVVVSATALSEKVPDPALRPRG